MFDVDESSLEKTHFSVRVECESANWYTYSSVKLGFTKSIVVTNGTLSPNTILTRDHLRIENLDVARIRHTAFYEIEALIGAKVKHRVRDGQAIQKNMLCFVCSGDRVTIAARVGTMQVKTSGIAKEDGTLGDTIEVMNTRSKKTIYGQVVNTQEVVVSL